MSRQRQARRRLFEEHTASGKLAERPGSPARKEHVASLLALEDLPDEGTDRTRFAAQAAG